MKVNSIFQTMQGEGSKAGAPAIFVRFSGCNLWSGKEESRETGRGSCSLWCDTEFFNGSVMGADQVLSEIKKLTVGWSAPLVVFSGGEPMLQLRSSEGLVLVEELLTEDFSVAIETNGTFQGRVIRLLNEHPNGHVTVSPKKLKKTDNFDHIVVRTGTDLKVVWPNDWVRPILKEFSGWDFEHFYLQPKDEHDTKANKDITDRTMNVASTFGWKVSIQTHKKLGLP